MQLRDTRILLTGASGGIGQILVERLCAAGAKLLLAGRSGEALEYLAQRFSGQVSLVYADLTRAQDRQQVADAVRRQGGVDCVINAAGINQFSLLEQQSEDAIARLIGVNVTATLQLTHLLLPLLRQQPRALLVNLGSTFGSIGFPGFTAYCASKFALRGFSEALRRELADSRIKVLYIAPRATRTAMNSAQVVAMNDALKVEMDDPQQVAEEILRAIVREREELYLGWPEKLFVRLNGILPRLVDQALRKQLPVVKRFADADRPRTPPPRSDTLPGDSR
ncbi:SDR family oxidoreductase [Stutzerimonas stutzeri]|uniref:SDR family oxidoreductase n=1 Tax=Stutzerimonas stutzeri TaxID=316 RepID=UPI000E3AAA84|nr:SDR family oxidoreductase [Stutzerimonas stutzeri]MBW8456211.1 SDR family oxidoreductase [Pseudomonas sp.]MDH0085162.1 SDR family oxidoreductase [Stutzerimonas stutzeri]RFF61333.1 SDR family oxidoreductase [Stutzerimonas stutzeri]GBC55478.1 short-chain dehydrogenase/reductase SDR [Stutzerimonas stutzeri]HCA64399.1 short chain dehydrogenase [Pseudomonas sp.]